MKLTKEQKEKVESLLSQMTLDEKIGQMNQESSSIVGGFDIPVSELQKMIKDGKISREELEVLMVWIGDKLANMRAIYRDWKIEGHAMWQRFNQTDPNEQAWYYRSVAKLTQRLSHTSAWLEYQTLTELVFGEGNET